MIYQFPIHNTDSGALLVTVITSTGNTVQEVGKKIFRTVFEMPLEIDHDLNKFRFSNFTIELKLFRDFFDNLDSNTKIIVSALDGYFHWEGYLSVKRIWDLEDFITLTFYDPKVKLVNKIMSDVTLSDVTAEALSDIAVYLGLSFVHNDVTLGPVSFNQSDSVLSFIKKCMTDLSIWIYFINGMQITSKLISNDIVTVEKSHIRADFPRKANYLGEVRLLALDKMGFYFNPANKLQIGEDIYKIKAIQNSSFENDVIWIEVVKL